MTKSELNVYKTLLFHEFELEVKKNLKLSQDESHEMTEREINNIFQLQKKFDNIFFFKIVENVHVGYLVYKIDKIQRSVFILHIYILPQFRNRQFGQNALKILEKSVAKQDVEKVFLNVFYRNKGAIRLYKKLGYSISNCYMHKKV